MRALSAFLLTLGMAAWAGTADLVVDGTSLVIDHDTTVDGSVIVENGGHLTVRNARLTLLLEYDEEHRVDVAGTSELIIDNGQVDSEGGQFWFELYADSSGSPTLTVSGEQSWLTNHSGIRPYDATRIVVTGGDVEELQVRDQVTVELSSAAAYPVFFFDGGSASLSGLDVGQSVSTSVSVPGGWSMSLTDAAIEGYQIDLMNGAVVDLTDGDGIVLSVHTPGNLGPDLRVVEGVTSPVPASGSLTNLGTEFHFTNSQIALLNVYVFGSDRVLLRGVHVNEANAEATSELIIGQEGYQTPLNCNLCQVYDHATFTVDHATIDSSDNVPSATASYHDIEQEGYGVMTFREMDLRELYLTAREHGVIRVNNCQYDPAKLEVLDPTATFTESTLTADFTAAPTSGPAPLDVQFTDHSAGEVVAWSWTFGDGGGSSEQSPLHRYTTAGTYSVSLTATGPAGADTVTKSNLVTVTNEQPQTCVGEPVFVAAAAHASGALGSLWRSDVAIYNRGSAEAALGLRLLAADQDNSQAPCVAGGTVPAGASLLLEDVLATSFGVSSGVGGLEIYGGSDLVVMSRTFNQTTAGTYGQTIPGRAAAEAIASGDTGDLVQLFENAAYRTNVGMLNLGDQTAAVVVTLYAENGSELGTRELSLPPRGQHQENRIFTLVTQAAVANGRAVVEVTSGGPVLAYASVVDNQTSDPSFIEPR